MVTIEACRLPCDDAFLGRHTHELSGGHLQRVALARALVLAPKLLVADDAVAMLDPSEQAKLLQLLKHLQVERGMAMVLISHDLSVVLRIADRAAGRSVRRVKRATFGAGCFWGTEHVLRSIPGVVACRVGYMGGTVDTPSYEQVHGGTTGHVEVCEVTYDPAHVSYEMLLDVFWQMHDPTSRDDQGPYERGSQYRAVIFYHGAEQAALADASKTAVEESGRHSLPIQTEIRAAGTFWPAEEYHQEYIAKGGDHHCNVFTRSIEIPKS